MQKLSRLHLLAIFLLTVVVTFGVLLITSMPPETAAPTVTPYIAALYPTPIIAPTAAPYVLPSQCSDTGEKYELRLASFSDSGTKPYATFTSPDGLKVFYKKGDDVFVGDEKGHTYDFGSDVPYSDIIGRVFWSPNSHFVVMSPFGSSQMGLFDTSNGQSIPITGVDTVNDFKGWSADGEHFIFGNTDFQTSSIWSASSGARTYTISNQLGPLQWSPDGHWLSYTAADYDPTNSRATFSLALAAADGSAAYRYPLILPKISDYNYSYVANNYQLYWSPDSHYLAFDYRITTDQTYQRLVVFSMDGTLLPGGSLPASIMQAYNPSDQPPDLSFQPATWSKNSLRFDYVRQSAADQFQVITYVPGDDASTVITPPLFKPPFYPPSMTMMGLYTSQNDLYSIQIVNLRGAHLGTLVENATDAGNPDWSPDEKWVAAVWAEGKGLSRTVHLTWMHPDGSERHDLYEHFKDVRELRWLNNNQLGYIAWRGDEGNSIETVDLQTGERRVLAEGLETVTNPEYDADKDILSFWWKADETIFGKDAYHADGTQLYHVTAAGDFNRPRSDFWSPDGKIMALKMEPVPYMGLMDYVLELAYTDGRSPVVARVGLDALDVPFWSPDSRMVSFAQWVRGDGITPSPTGLAVISDDGLTLWYDNNFWSGTPLDWFSCGA